MSLIGRLEDWNRAHKKLRRNGEMRKLFGDRNVCLSFIFMAIALLFYLLLPVKVGISLVFWQFLFVSSACSEFLITPSTPFLLIIFLSNPVYDFYDLK